MSANTKSANKREAGSVSGFTLSFGVAPDRAAPVAQICRDVVAADVSRHPLVSFLQFAEQRGAERHGFSISARGCRLVAEMPELPERLAQAIRSRMASMPETPPLDIEIGYLSADKDKPPRPAPVWKRWALSMIGVYPLLVALFYLLQPITAQLPVPGALFLVALVLTGLNTGYVLPFLNRRLGGWLSR